jgi:FkbM family methyltransferase
MLIQFKYLLDNYKMNITGIIHIGAHECEEIHDYEKIISRDKILWVEAIPEKVNHCKNSYPQINIEEAVVSNKNEEVEFKISNNGQSSSFLELGLHRSLYPEIYYINSFKTVSKTMNEILEKYRHIPFNFINLDIQGTELKALKGMEKYLPSIDYIYTEVNSCYVYQDCAIVQELDDYLANFNFIRVKTEWVCNGTWGDAFYIKQS